jgi:hypothetical protein
MKAGSRYCQVRKVDFMMLLAFGLFTWRNNFIITYEFRYLLCVKPSLTRNSLHFIHTAFVCSDALLEQEVLISP